MIHSVLFGAILLKADFVAVVFSSTYAINKPLRKILRNTSIKIIKYAIKIFLSQKNNNIA